VEKTPLTKSLIVGLGIKPDVQMRISPAHSIKARGMPYERAEYKDATDLTVRVRALLGKRVVPI
jgi:hypothetical protein